MSKRVLILCTGNSARSQMAEGLWNKYGGGAWEAQSAGSSPAGYVHPLAIRAMSEVGIDISRGRSKSINEVLGQDFDLVVTVCENAKESCPVLPGAKDRLHWSFDDPAAAKGDDAEKLRVFRRVRDEVAAAVRTHLSEPSQDQR
jgi:arsenate reductase (thioredoxin)